MGSIRASKADMLPRTAFLALLTALVFVHAQAPVLADDRPWKIHIELQAITLPAKDALKLLPELSDEKSMPAAWAKIEAMLTGEQAKVAGILLGEAHRERIEIHQGEEVRYATEFSQPAPIEKPAGEANTPTQNLGIGFGPTAFEMRKTGLMLTASADVSDDGKHIVVTATPEHVWMLGWQEFECGRLPNNEKLFIKQPRFATVKTSATFAFESGERTLVSFHRVPGSETDMELFLLRAWTTPRGPEKK
jgi:hypothetical protein